MLTLARVEQLLDDAHGGDVVEVVDQLDVAPQTLGHLPVERLKRVALRLGREELVELLDGVGEGEHVRVLRRRLLKKRLYLADPAAVEVEERPAAHGRVLDGRGVYLRGRDVGLHDAHVRVGDVHRGGRGRYQVRPRVPLIEQRV
jgi:hypothetical protein